MRLFLKLFFLLFFVLPLALAGLLYLAVDTEPSINRAAEITPSNIERAKRILDRVVRELGFREMTTDSSVAKVSIVGAGVQNAPGYAARMFGALATAKVNIEMITTSEIRITCMIAEDDLETAVRALHEAFELGAEQVEAEHPFGGVRS